MTPSRQLRSCLLDITQRFTGESVGDQVVAVENLKGTYQHQIRVAKLVNLSDIRSWRFNCHAFTFGLWRHELFWELQESHPHVWPDGAFVTCRLIPQMVRLPVGKSNQGAVVLYYEGEQLKHSGVTQGRIIRSKWGDCHTWDHRLWEVPLSYGRQVLYHKAPDPQFVINAYVQFARCSLTPHAPDGATTF